MRFLRRRFAFLDWLSPGLHLKRWLLLVLLGMAIMALGLAYILRQAYVEGDYPGSFYYLTLQFLPRLARALLFVTVSLSLVIFGMIKLNETILRILLGSRRPNEKGFVSTIYSHYTLRRGPRVVAIGGGTGLSWLLQGLKKHTSNLTAVVTVADDGGSTGRLRREMGVLAPGDLRKCISSMAATEGLMSQLFEYRFPAGSGLEGHSFGNLFIVAMAGVTGNMEEALKETSKVLAVTGQILPSTLEDVNLYARTHDQELVYGEHNITERGGGIRDVHIDPADAQAYPEAVEAIHDADLIVAGPGSLFTSIIPNFLVPDLRRAFIQSRATKIYVCNVATQHGETDAFSVTEHYDALERHIGHTPAFDYVLANSNIRDQLPPEARSEPVRPPTSRIKGVKVALRDVVSEENRYRHDSHKLAAAVLRLYDEGVGREERSEAPELVLAP
ncbi:MAG: uridine diphosphate-N-acetylglucosamine-binding protein YvcK [Dehalococcoidia bacterium]